MRPIIMALGALAILGAALPTQAAAGQVKAGLDCPLRDAPFSIDTPLVDILLSPAAKKLVDDASGGRLARIPAQFAGTQPPTFAAILSLRDAAMFTGLSAQAVTALDPALRALPVTHNDKLARCARYDDVRPSFARSTSALRVLMFEKVNGFYHQDAIPAARDALAAMAARKGWALSVTDKGGAINPSTLRQFDLVIWNNNSGDVLTLTQRNALKRFLERGGGFVGIHGAGGDTFIPWGWYADRLLGARFKGHPMAPQFQDARVVVDAPRHPIAKVLPRDWTMSDEWYSFHNNPRLTAGSTVILSLDETTYKPTGMMNQDLRMGDHPLAWTNCIGKGRAFYSAIGHRAESYRQPEHLALLESAIEWAADQHQTCHIAE